MLTPSQQKAVETTNRSVAVIANAGAGKTRVLIERFRHLIVEEHVPVWRILAFTFTEKAAGEIRQRILAEKMIRPEEESGLAVGTIHSFLARFLRQEGGFMGLDPGFRIQDEAEASLESAGLTKDFILEKLKESDPRISFWVNHYGFKRLQRLFIKLLRESRLFFLPEAKQDPSDPAFRLLSVVREFFFLNLERKKREGLLHFDDLEFLGVTLLKDNQTLREKIKKRWRHLLVDEFQDTSPLQAQLIELVHQRASNILFIVGDPNQSIYRFRNADFSLFKKAVEKIKEEEGEVVALSETFRLSPRLCRVLNKIFTSLIPSFSPLVPLSAEEKGEIVIVVMPRGQANLDQLRAREASFLAQKIKALNLDPSQREKTALLFRTGTPMPFYEEALKKEGIPCKITKTENLLNHPVIRDLIHLLNYLSGDKSLITQTGILRSLFFGFSESFIEHYTMEAPPDLLTGYTSSLFMRGEDRKEWEKLTRLIACLEEEKKFVRPSILFPSLIPRLNDATEKSREPLGIFDEFSEERLFWEQGLRLLEKLEEGLEDDSYQKIVCGIRALQEEEGEVPSLHIPDSQQALQLMTIHAAKGLEFERVFLPQLYAPTPSKEILFLFDPQKGIAFKKEEGSEVKGLKRVLSETPLFKELGLAREQEAREEAIRLLYVAMTRGSSHLTLFLREPAQNSLKFKETSNWNDWLWVLLEEERKNAHYL